MSFSDKHSYCHSVLKYFMCNVKSFQNLFYWTFWREKGSFFGLRSNYACGGSRGIIKRPTRYFIHYTLFTKHFYPQKPKIHEKFMSQNSSKIHLRSLVNKTVLKKHQLRDEFLKLFIISTCLR